MRKCLDKSGLKRSNGHGHGIGLEPREYPMIYRGVEKKLTGRVMKASADASLEENMVINLETPYYYLGVGSFHIEKSFVVTTRGFRELIPQKRETPFIME